MTSSDNGVITVPAELKGAKGDMLAARVTVPIIAVNRTLVY